MIEHRDERPTQSAGSTSSLDTRRNFIRAAGAMVALSVTNISLTCGREITLRETLGTHFDDAAAIRLLDQLKQVLDDQLLEQVGLKLEVPDYTSFSFSALQLFARNANTHLTTGRMATLRGLEVGSSNLPVEALEVFLSLDPEFLSISPSSELTHEWTEALSAWILRSGARWLELRLSRELSDREATILCSAVQATDMHLVLTLPSISADVAEVLASFRGWLHVSLANKGVDRAIIDQFSRYQGERLSLWIPRGLTSLQHKLLDNCLSQKLAERYSFYTSDDDPYFDFQLVQSRLTHLDDEAVATVLKCRSSSNRDALYYLESCETYSLTSLKALLEGHRKGQSLQLGFHTLSAESAVVLLEVEPETLFFPKLRTLNAETATVLAGGRCDLVLTISSEIDEATAKALVDGFNGHCVEGEDCRLLCIDLPAISSHVLGTLVAFEASLHIELDREPVDPESALLLAQFRGQGLSVTVRQSQSRDWGEALADGLGPGLGELSFFPYQFRAGQGVKLTWWKPGLPSE